MITIEQKEQFMKEYEALLRKHNCFLQPVIKQCEPPNPSMCIVYLELQQMTDYTVIDEQTGQQYDDIGGHLEMIKLQEMS